MNSVDNRLKASDYQLVSVFNVNAIDVTGWEPAHPGLLQANREHAVLIEFNNAVGGDKALKVCKVQVYSASPPHPAY